MENKPVVHLGSTVEKAIKGEYKIDIKMVLQQAWLLTVKSRSAVNFALIITLLIGVFTILLMSTFMGGLEAIYNDHQSMAMVNIVVTLVTSPFLAGVEMIGVLNAVNIKTHAKLVFAFLQRGSWVAICALLSSTLSSIGFSLFIIPGLFLAVAFSLALPLVVEKHYSPLNALIISVKALRHQWFQLFALYGMLSLAAALVVLPLAVTKNSEFVFVALIFALFSFSYLVPLYFNLKGVLYREIFGVQVAMSKPNDQGDNNSDSMFSA